MESKTRIFISYASENEKFASELSGLLKSHGLEVWYAPDSIAPGDRIISSIESGMQSSNFGIVLLSKEFLKKPWPTHELNRLFTKFIEKKCRLFPIWIGVDKSDIEGFLPSLSDVFAVEYKGNFLIVAKKLLAALADGAPTHLVQPSYESSKFRFFSGRGEMAIGPEGPATTLWEFLVHAKEHEYPVSIEGEVFTKAYMLFRAASFLTHVSERVKRLVGEDGYKTIEGMCLEAGLNPNDY